jgi:hypothetical protein
MPFSMQVMHAVRVHVEIRYPWMRTRDTVMSFADRDRAC